jgi:hypothetical protein
LSAVLRPARSLGLDAIRVTIAWRPGKRPPDQSRSHRACARTEPLFDTFGHNPYPEHPDEPPWAEHDDAYIGQGDHGRLLAALKRAVEGTGQPGTKGSGRLWRRQLA